MKKVKQMMLMLWLFGVILIHTSLAAPRDVQAAPQQTTNVSISLVIDNSGSMRDSDPDNLRQTASEILLDLLSPEDLIGVVRFSDTATEVFPLQVAGENKQGLKETLGGSFATSGATDYLKALQMAAQQLEKAPADSQKLILFLTDGLPEQQIVGGKIPIPEAEYLKKLNEHVQVISERGIPIYPVGFGKDETKLDKKLLEEMALSTKGGAFVLTDPNAIASAFFETLAVTKRRNPIEELHGLTFQEQAIAVPVGSYTQQVTVLITTDGTELAVEQTGGKQEEVTLQNHPSYSILTVNQKRPGTNNEVPLAIKTNGTAIVSAARDLFFKMDVLQPEGNIVKSLSEPFMIETVLSQPLESGMTVTAKVLKNGVPDRDALELKEQEDGSYSVLYDQVDTLGDYQVLISVKKDAETIAEAGNSFSVKNIPALKSDVVLDGQQFTIGGSIVLTSYLELQKLRIEENADMEINQYHFYLRKDKNTFRKFPLADSTDSGTGDILSGDGLYTGRIPIDEKGTFDAYIQVKGIYKGEKFVQELDLGSFKVVDSGTMEVVLLGDTATKNKSGLVEVPVRLTNHSEKEETVAITVPEATGSISQAELVLAAGESKEEMVTLQLNDSGAETAELSFRPENTQVLVLEGPKRIVYLSPEKSLLERIIGFYQNNQILVLAIIGLPVFIYLLGRLLYQFLVYKKLTAWEEIAYYPKGSDDLEIIFPKKGKNHLRIAIGEAAGPVDLVLPGSPGMALEIKKQLDKKPKPKFIEGYEALSKNNTFVMEVKALAPGYLKHKGQILSQLTVERETIFEAGGYQFICRLEPSEASLRKNLLEGKEV